MSVRETLEAFLPPHRLEAMDNRCRTRLYSVARTTLSIAGALAMAQHQRCFHCAGIMPTLYRANDRDAPTREHALPAARREAGIQHQAQLLAHSLCNTVRAETPFTLEQWDRAVAIWYRADRHWLEAGKGASPFIAWVALARECQRELRS